MSDGRGIIVAFIDGFLCNSIPPCSKCLSGPYMWSDLTGFSVVSGNLRIVLSFRYDLKLDITGQ